MRLPKLHNRVLDRNAKAQAMGAGIRKTTPEAFLEACPQPTRPFFQALLDGARQRGLRVGWGEKGFAVGTSVETHGVRTSFAYGFPPGTNDFAEARLEVYLHQDAFPADQRALIGKRLLAVAPFRKGGQFTLRLKMDAAGVAVSEAALAVLWEVEAELRGR